MHKTLSQHNAKFGFTLIELLVVMGIMGLITGIVVFNQGDLSDTIALTNTANEISLETRQAQTFGISVKQFDAVSNDFSIAYGMEFNISIGDGGSNTAFTGFADNVTKNGYFDSPGSCATGSECLKVNRIGRGNIISGLCGVVQDGGCLPVSRVAVTYLRPDPSARILFFDSNGLIVSINNSVGAKIIITSPKGHQKRVTIYNTGQISID